MTQTTQTQQTTAEVLAPLAAQLADLQDKIAHLRDQETALKGKILDAVHGDPDTYQAGDIAVQVTQAARLDLAAIAKAYPATTHPQLYKLTPDTKAVRHHIAEADLDEYTVHSAPAVRLS